MSQIEELQSRITAAMARISTGLEALSADNGDDSAALVAALEEEKLANAQMQERVRAIKESHAAELDRARATAADTGEADQLRSELAAQSDAMARLDMDLQRLRQSNDQLRATNSALREANEAGVGDAHLINKAMLAELEGLRAAREADLAEANALLSKLEPLLAAAGTTTAGEGA